jgi:hypothetical protein
LTEKAQRVCGDTRVLRTEADLRPVYAVADVVLLPSRTEGMPGPGVIIGTPDGSSRRGGHGRQRPGDASCGRFRFPLARW